MTTSSNEAQRLKFTTSRYLQTWRRWSISCIWSKLLWKLRVSSRQKESSAAAGERESATLQGQQQSTERPTLVAVALAKKEISETVISEDALFPVSSVSSVSASGESGGNSAALDVAVFALLPLRLSLILLQVYSPQLTRKRPLLRRVAVANLIVCIRVTCPRSPEIPFRFAGYKKAVCSGCPLCES